MNKALKLTPGKIFVLICFSFLIFGKLHAQELKFIVNGKVIIDIKDSLTPNVDITVMKNNKLDKKISTKSKYKFELDFQNEYIFIFEKQDYATKEIYFNTTVPKDILNNGFEPFPFNVELYRKDSGKGKIKIKNPVARIKYDAAKDAFDYQVPK
jgi:hypothetical protein